ncbi:hypothetical protein Pcinc_024592 [Petrolisthes cinctipes]|uniref:Ionotropic glutamate receptor C-terminal domain-containing protein n=1 Tax=Petrolisthes cinctipes TaxID=88211 RepID=A0AAE1FAL6_PETCI|nr:hypothetical protein Pcinc_024592 [Petrolisthes cinctipes]
MYSGVMPLFWEALTQHIGRCFVYHHYSVGGLRMSNGTWTGGIGSIISGEFDMTSILILTKDRFQDLGVSDFIFIGEHAAGYQRPSVQSDIAGFIKPFTPWVWLVVLVTMGTVMLSLYVFASARQQFLLPFLSPSSSPVRGVTGKDRREKGNDRGETWNDRGETWNDIGEVGKDRGETWSDRGETVKDRREKGNDRGEVGKDRGEVGKDRGETGKANETSQQPHDQHQRGSSSSSSGFGLDAVMWTVGALLTQSVSLEPPRGVVRGLTGLWLLLSLILATVYRSNLKAMIILPKVTLPFNNLEELTKAGLPVWIALDSVLYDMIYNSEPQTTLGRLNHTVYNYDMEYSIPGGIRDYQNGRHVMVIPLAPLMFLTHLDYTQNGRCKTYIMAETFAKNSQWVIYFRKGSPLKAQLDPVCLKPIKAEIGRALDLGDFYGIFSIYAGGMVMALWCFLVESLVGRSRRQGK